MGAGMWGTTFAQVLCDAGTPAVLWARSPELAETIGARHENPGYLPGIALTPAGVTHPYRDDPRDRTLRLAPTYPDLPELELAVSSLATCIRLAGYEKLAATDRP